MHTSKEWKRWRMKVTKVRLQIVEIQSERNKSKIRKCQCNVSKPTQVHKKKQLNNIVHTVGLSYKDFDSLQVKD